MTTLFEARMACARAEIARKDALRALHGYCSIWTGFDLIDNVQARREIAVLVAKCDEARRAVVEADRDFQALGKPPPITA